MSAGHDAKETVAVRPLFAEDEIAERVQALAAEIAEGLSGPVTLVVLLKGAFVFAADLLRALGRLGLAPRVEFLRLSSYGLGRESSGEVRQRGEPPAGIEGQSVLLVDDILDSGRTLTAARQALRDLGAREIRTCVLLDKPARREVAAHADHVGFVIDDVFVVGYGIDFAEQYRHLPYIGRVE